MKRLRNDSSFQNILYFVRVLYEIALFFSEYVICIKTEPPLYSRQLVLHHFLSVT